MCGFVCYRQTGRQQHHSIPSQCHSVLYPVRPSDYSTL
jgi:hypothetical protein